MNDIYHTLTLKVGSEYALFESFLDDAVPVGYEEIDGGFIIRSDEELDDLAWGIEQFHKALEEALDKSILCEMIRGTEKNEDWVKTFQEGVSPVEVGPFYIHPTWHEAKAGLLNIVVDPALAFGTGHHPTTATCLEAIAKVVQPGQEILDVGCGSGILSIAALKLGAVVDACDTDPLSIENAGENAQANDVAYHRLWEGSVQKRTQTYDVVIANILADVLVMLASELKAATNPGGILILSGILDKYEDKVRKAFSDCDVIAQQPLDEWVTLTLKKV